MAAARVPLGARGILGLRAQAAGDAESPDPTVSKALGEAWIAADKAKTLKDLLGVCFTSQYQTPNAPGRG